MRKVLILLPIYLILFSCGPDKSTPEYAAKQYLTALKNQDWKTAKKYANENTRYQIDMYQALGSDFGITEIRDIKCEVKGSLAICYFCCSKNTGFKKLFLKLNDKNEWVANESKASFLEYNNWDEKK